MREVVILAVVMCAGCLRAANGDGDASPGGSGADGNQTTHHDGGNTTVDAPIVNHPDGFVFEDAPPFPCRNKVTSNLTSGHHNAGADCTNCHSFSIAGTLYTTATGNTGMSGASITVTDHNGQSFDLVSQLDGNFYTSASVAFPITLTASSCPNVAPMVNHVTSAQGGGCNQNGCHDGGVQAQIHLP
jgi:hypothetical protein